MPLHPSLVLVLTSVLGIVMACLLMAVGMLWGRVRSFPIEETTRLIDNLARRQETIEGLLSRLEVSPETTKSREPRRDPARTAPGGTRAEAMPGQRIDPAAATAVGGPTLIAVPSLSASPSSESATNASATAAEELAQ